jgi:hypothetical protein
MAGAALQYLHHEGLFFCSGRLHDKIEQLPPLRIEQLLTHFEWHRATLGASMMSKEQEKNVLNWGYE